MTHRANKTPSQSQHFRQPLRNPYLDKRHVNWDSAVSQWDTLNWITTNKGSMRKALALFPPGNVQCNQTLALAEEWLIHGRYTRTINTTENNLCTVI